MGTNSVCSAMISENFYTPDHFKALYTNQSKLTFDSSKLPSIDELEYCLSESLHIEDGPKIPPFDRSDNVGVQGNADCKDLVEIDTSAVTATEEFSKTATFPCSGKTPLPAFSTDGESEGVNDTTAATMKQANCESSEISMSLPCPLKLVSAMKGTREKLGTHRDKLSVTWAPDVYDPIPSAPSTAVLNNKPRRKSERKKSIESKKNGKNKQKKKSSKGSSSSSGSSKDKRPVQKYYRGSNVFYESFESKGKLVVEGFDCGSTFLKTSVTNMHFSVAEAT